MFAGEQCRSGVLVIAHGSPSPQWNQVAMGVVDKLRDRLAGDSRIVGVSGGFLEMARPSVAEAVDQLMAHKPNRIVAVPLFVAPSGHVIYDVPTVLGVLHWPRLRQHISQEGLAVVQPRVPVIITAPLSEGESLRQFVLSQFRRLSQDPAREHLLVVLHGDEDFRPQLDALAGGLVEAVVREAGIYSGNFAYAELGDGYGRSVIPSINNSVSKGLRVIVVALYVATSAKSLHARWVKEHAGGEDPLADKPVIFSEQLLAEHPAVLDDLVRFVTEAL